LRFNCGPISFMFHQKNSIMGCPVLFISQRKVLRPSKTCSCSSTMYLVKIWHLESWSDSVTNLTRIKKIESGTLHLVTMWVKWIFMFCKYTSIWKYLLFWEIIIIISVYKSGPVQFIGANGLRLGPRLVLIISESGKDWTGLTWTSILQFSMVTRPVSSHKMYLQNLDTICLHVQSLLPSQTFSIILKCLLKCQVNLLCLERRPDSHIMDL